MSENMERLENDFYFDMDDNAEEDVVEYDITTSPRDWTPSNIVELIDSGIMELPLFQRNYVWDIKKASKLIESLLLGLPVPELFVYVDGDEDSTYRIIDGQQRILSIYFFMKGRFPKNTSSRNQIKSNLKAANFDEQLMDNRYYRNFELKLNADSDERKSRYHGKKFVDLEKDMQIKFRLRRYVRAIAIRQNKPDNNSASMFEIFNRLNTGGVKLNNQEIRASLYYCGFYDMLLEMNADSRWRALLNNTTANLHSSDVELILRAFALLHDGEVYAPKMVSFLNAFSKKSMSFRPEYVSYLKELFASFIEACSGLGYKCFFNGNKFYIALFEATFAAACKGCFSEKKCLTQRINKESFERLKSDEEFTALSKDGSTSKEKVLGRLKIAADLIRLDGENE